MSGVPKRLWTSSVGSNPMFVNAFLKLKGIKVPETKSLDIIKGENRSSEEYSKVNPLKTVPALELENGQVLTEIVAIAEYLEELHPAHPMIGTTPLERAETRTWWRKIDMNICTPMIDAFRSGEGLQLFQSRIRTAPEAVSVLKQTAHDGLKFLDKHLEGKEWICGSRFTVADLQLFAWIETFGNLGQPLDQSLKNVVRLIEQVKKKVNAA